jgi:hypothetical protein
VNSKKWLALGSALVMALAWSGAVAAERARRTDGTGRRGGADRFDHRAGLRHDGEPRPGVGRELPDENPGVTISVTGGGSGTGIASLINGTVDFANASREMKDEEIQLAADNGIEAIEHESPRTASRVVVTRGTRLPS